MPEKKAFNLNEIIATNTAKEENPSINLVQDYSDEVEECENANQISILKTKTNNLSSLNQKISVKESCCKKAFTEPSTETPYTAYNSNHSNQSNKLVSNDTANKRMFPLIENGSYHNEDSFDYSVNEE